MAEKKPSLFGKFFKGLTGDKVTSKEIQEAEGIVKRDPSNLRALHKLGDLHAKAEQFDKAIEIYVQAATSYVERAFYQKAVAVYKQILKIRPDMHDIQERLAEVYLELGRRSDALAQYQGLARKHETSGALSLAAEMILKMLHLDEENVPLRVKLAELYLAMSEQQLAIAEFEKALNSLATQNHWNDYLKVGERLLFVSPTHVSALKTIARVYLDHGDVMKAMGKLQQAFKLDRRDPETLEVLAVAFDRLGQPEKTISVLKELAEIYQDLERFDYVRDVYQQIIERDPSDTTIRQALAQLPISQSSQGLPAAGSSASRPALPAAGSSASRQALPAAGSNAALPASSHTLREPPPPPSFPDRPPPPPRTPPIAAAPPRTPPIAAAPPTPPAPAIEPSLSLSDEEIERLLNEADVYIKYGLVPRVEEALNRVFAAVPSHPEARRLKVELLKMQERTEEAARELLSLAKESQDSNQALTFLEQVLELEDVSATLQEEAYQMTIRLSPNGQPSTPSTPPPPAPAALPNTTEPTMQITSEDELDIVALDSFDDLEEIPEEPAIISQDDMEIVSIDELDVVSLDSIASLPQADAPPIHNQFNLPTPAYAQQHPSGGPFDDVGIVDLDDEVEEIEEDPTTHQPVLFAATPPAAPATAPLFSPPPPRPREAPPEDDPFSQFLKRNKHDDPIEEEYQSDFHDFLSAPLVVENNVSASEPTRSEGGDELSEMEAAAARLAALIEAKEAADIDDVVEELNEVFVEEEVAESTPVPPPFALPPTPIAPPAPFAAPPPQEPKDAFTAEDAFASTSPDDGTNPSLETLSSLSGDDFAEHNNQPTNPGLAAATANHDSSFADADEDAFDFADDGAFDELDGAFGDIQEDNTPETIIADSIDEMAGYESLDEYEEIEAIEFDPTDPYADEIEEASLYLDQDEPQYAIEIFDRILQEDASHELANAGLQLALAAENRLQNKVQQHKGLLYDLDSALGEITTTKRERDRVEGELKAFKEEAEKQFGEDGEALFELGIAYHGMMLFDMSIDTFRSCLRNQFRVFDSHKMIGACYNAQGQHDKALAAYNEALALPGINTEERLDILFEMGTACEDAGEFEQSLAHFEEVSLLDDQYRGVMRKVESLQLKIQSMAS